MEYRVKVTVLDKKLFPELQAQYCAIPNSGKCPCYHVGDEFLFCRNDQRDDYWHMGAGTLVKSGKPDEGVLLSPGTMHCGTEGVLLLGGMGCNQQIYLCGNSGRGHYAWMD